MSGDSVQAPFPGRLVEDTVAAVSLAGELAEPLRREIAPRLPEPERTEAIRLADLLASGRCCTGEVAAGLARLLAAIDAKIAAGTTLVERPPDGRLIAGRGTPILERRLTPEAEALRQAAVPLRELRRLVRAVRDLAAALRELRRLFGE
ncbi:hypothetical protein [uncultured Jannaschia sp.]|uniref:hypothetical protein n=1 Tax=uncultured Jannaschia sp. TaxID=293347 RepID=UPI00261D5EF5|nr:hypothetical protein [uncultured Jannaschia sp.]